MKKQLLVIALLFATVAVNAQAVRTSIAAGLATNPFTWDCTCFPLPGDSIIINHAVILNNDFGYTSGAIIINASGSLTGDIPMRAFATYGTGRFENHGTFNVARVVLFGGSAHNTNNFNADSLLTNVVNEGGFTNTGNMQISTSFLNTGDLNVSASGLLVVQDNFLHGDTSVAASVHFVCDGTMRVNQDWGNADSISGSGQICIYGTSANWGSISGTLDMCDVSGGGQVDGNFGTIAGSVTTCVSPCNVGVAEYQNIPVQLYPNPSSDFIQIKSEQKTDIMIFDLLGKLVYQSSTANQLHNVSIGEWPAGVYNYRAITNDGMATGKFIKQ